MREAYEHRDELFNALTSRMTRDTSMMVLEAEVEYGAYKKIKVPITGMEPFFPTEEGTGKEQVNSDNMDERFESPIQAIVAHRVLNETSKNARKLFWDMRANR